MIEVARTSDPVRLAFLQAALAEAGIESAVFDGAAGALWPGAIPRRLMVDERDAWRAGHAIRHAIRQAEDAMDAADRSGDAVSS